MVYNNEAFIERTLLSILENDTKYFDIIINDDCSTDNSVSIIEKFLSNHKARTKQWHLSVNKVNLGINASIKNILAIFKNDWVKYFAGDDEFERDSLSEYYNLSIMNDPRSSIVLSGMNLIDRNSDFISKRSSLSPYFYENHWLKTANLYINTINAPSVMIGRETLLAALNETKVKNAEDWPVLRFCISKNIDFKVSKKILVNYRLHQSSLSSSYNSSIKTKKNINRIIDQVEILLNENNVLANSFSVRLGIYIQLKILKADSSLERFAYKAIKLANVQFCIFRILALIDARRDISFNRCMEKIIFTTKEIVKKILYKLFWTSSIDWSSRVNKMGADSVYDSRTLEKDKNKTTKEQTELYSMLINKELYSSKVSQILDYGCGTGRHYEFLSSLNSLDSRATIFGFDPTSELLKFSQNKGYSDVSDQFNYELKYDLIFCHMVLGGLNDRDLELAIKDMTRSLNFNGRVILVEAVNNIKPRLHTKWRARSQESYMPPIDGIEWSILGETYENDDCLKIIMGKFNTH
tara:strand:- start:5686 stop:7257 length:1572 start_codon:yes stop_codon:yes gene_type:complete